MTESKTNNKEEYTCKNCGERFHGNYCPECGQSVKEFERPVQFLIVDFMGNMFAFDTRFWKTFVAVLFKPGTLALDYVKGHRVKYMPPFRFYVFISFIFFLLLSYYTSEKTKLGPDKEKNVTIFDNYEVSDSLSDSRTDSLNISDKLLNEPKKKDENAIKIAYLNEHPEVFFKQFLTNLSWAMFLLMPFYGFLLWLFYRKAQQYYITHFIMAINQHSFMFVVLIVVLLLAVLLPDFSYSFRYFLILLIPVYFAIGFKTLYQQKTCKIVLKLFAIGIVYISVVFAIAIGLIVLVVFQNGISLN
jgi:hypothetical protein